MIIEVHLGLLLTGICTLLLTIPMAIVEARHQGIMYAIQRMRLQEMPGQKEKIK